MPQGLYDPSANAYVFEKLGCPSDQSGFIRPNTKAGKTAPYGDVATEMTAVTATFRR